MRVHGSALHHPGSGAGAYLNDYTTLSNCVIRNNVSNGIGGGVYINSATGTGQTALNNCEITGNRAALGGGLCDRNSSTITNCKISNNIATTNGGGVYLYNTDKPTFRGCIVSNNTAVLGGGIYARGKCVMSNCDIVMNQATESYGGVFNENHYSTYTSCVLWGNEANGQPSQNSGQCKFEYCAVQGGISGDFNVNLPAENDGEEPGVYVRFVRPADGTGTEFEDADWRIGSRSICLNAGKPGSTGYTFDIDGNPRIQHELVDVGAYECNASLTHIEGSLDGGTYYFNGLTLHEPGYYTTVYPTPECDSVVGLTLEEFLGLEQYNADDVEAWHTSSIQVFDLSGRLIINRDGASTVSTNHLTPGVYILRLSIGNEVKTKKILVK